MLNIVYCANDKYFDGLYLSILSIVRRSKEDFCFTILTADLPEINKSYTRISDYHLSLIYKLIKDFNPNNEIKIFDCREKYLNAFKKQDIKKYSPYSMLKLFIPDYFDNEIVLYLDTDIMANNDIKSAFNVDMTDTEMCVCHEYNRDQILKQPNCKYFSGGVWLINIKKVKKTLAFTKAMNHYIEYHTEWNAEGAMNAVCTKIKFFPNEYDYNWQAPGIGESAVLKHFVYRGEDVTIKQWDHIGVKNILELHNWDEDYEYWLDQQNSWAKPKQIYNVLYSCNDGIFDGLYLSILSILNRTKEIINFYVMTADLTKINERYKPISQKHINILQKMIKSFNKQNTLTIIDCSQKYINTFGLTYDVKTFTAYTLLRLLADQIKQLDGLILYVDVDTLANGDIKEAWNVNMKCTEMCVCHDYWLIHNKKSNLPMFNAGVLLINLDFIRTTKYFKKAILYLLKYKPPMADQQALYWTWYRIRVWDDEYRFNYQQLGIESNTIIKHFNATDSNSINAHVIKPWEIENVQKVLNLHNWDKDYKIFLEQKKHW